ncbi:hypothetical protein QBC45DRAFT_336679 [Copromyces sp. CBS 386.78]|nr:hypothetical protein QBC45DRAFT_336679 [Copromyces sp. CBS 386.78]
MSSPTPTQKTMADRSPRSKQRVSMGAEADDPSSKTRTLAVSKQDMETKKSTTTTTTQCYLFDQNPWNVTDPTVQQGYGDVYCQIPYGSDLSDVGELDSDKDSLGDGQQTQESELGVVMASTSDIAEHTGGNLVTPTATRKNGTPVITVRLLSADSRRPGLSSPTAYTKDTRAEVITVTELPSANSSSSGPSDQTSGGQGEGSRNPPELLATQAGQQEYEYQAPPPNPTSDGQGENNRNQPGLVATQAGQHEYQAPPRKMDQVAYHDRMPGWTYHHPSPAWTFTSYPQGWLYYRPRPTWSYCDPSTGLVTNYWPGPHLAYNHQVQFWCFWDDIYKMWTSCTEEQAWCYLHPPMWFPHVCPDNAPDWTLYRVWPGPTFPI